MSTLKHKIRLFMDSVMSYTPFVEKYIDWKINRQLNKTDITRTKDAREALVKGHLERIRAKAAAGEPVKVAFLVVFDSVFQFESIYKLMCGNPAYEPLIYVIPDTVRGMDNQISCSGKTYQALRGKYGERVIQAYDPATDTYLDISGKADVFAFNNPYDNMTHGNYRAETLRNYGLCIFSDYGYSAMGQMCKLTYHTEAYHSFWRIFAHNEAERDLIADSNVYVCGYAKNDMFADVQVKEKRRKRVFVAPHHTIPGHDHEYLHLSTFPTFADFFLKLPGLYPQVDFIFRPHPLLFTKLKRNDVWGEERTEKWLADLQKNPNVHYDTAGDYADFFINSDGMIHDCASFLADYMYTGHPQCYLLRKHMNQKANFLDFGLEMLEHTYQAFTEKDILRFMDEVIVGGVDTMKEKRDRFAKEKIMVNYPNASQSLLAHLSRELGIGQRTLSEGMQG